MSRSRALSRSLPGPRSPAGLIVYPEPVVGTSDHPGNTPVFGLVSTAGGLPVQGHKSCTPDRKPHQTGKSTLYSVRCRSLGSRPLSSWSEEADPCSRQPKTSTGYPQVDPLSTESSRTRGVRRGDTKRSLELLLKTGCRHCP